MYNITCEYVSTIMSSNGYLVARYHSQEEITFPDGSKGNTFTAKGYMLPEQNGLRYILSGEFEKYTNKSIGQTSYTLAVTSCDEVLPTTADSTRAYLLTIKGIGKVTAKRLFEEFSFDVFDVIENHPEKLNKVRGLNQKTISKICADYAKRKAARKLFQYLYPFHIKESKIMRIHKKLGEHSLEKIKENPYRITEVSSVGFKTADTIAAKEGFPKNFPARIEAAICEVLAQAEAGGPLFSKNNPFPDFVYQYFLREPIYNLLFKEDELYVTGGTYITRDTAYLISLKLLEIPLSEADFNAAALRLKNAERIYISSDANEVRFYRYHVAKAEYQAAKKLAELMKIKIPQSNELTKIVNVAERTLQLKLSSEQEAAVKMAVENPVSIITGGPGTGKTSVQKGILEVFKTLYPNDEVILMAPTGRAAKRMSESTGYPAFTLHKALQIYSDEDGYPVEADEEFFFMAKLILVDEASMIGGLLLNTLLSHIPKGTRLVFIGDIDQLPSIEVGAVLREMIASGKIPVTKLTKTFRQVNGSSIAVNAARVKTGEKKLDYDNDYVMIEEETSDKIAESVSEQYKRLIAEYGEDEVVCLTAYRKRTQTGTNALNQSLRSAIRNDINGETPYWEKQGIRIYQGDRVMFTKNTKDLTNGDIGKVKSIHKSKDGISVVCIFDGVPITLEDDEIFYLDLAYAMTVHKSQGSEYKAVILVMDMAHRVMLKRNLFYTGLTRAKQAFYCIGMLSAVNLSIESVDSIYRKTRLGDLINFYANAA